MQLRNTDQRYGLVSIGLHWVVAITIIGLYFLGDYIVDLTYYDPQYNFLPDIHRGLGVFLFGLVIIRILWTTAAARPKPVSGVTEWESRLASLTHLVMYLLMVLIPISGYLISTADGRSLDVFGLFSIPAIETGIERQEELAGDIHEISANVLMGVVALHLLAALKHHFLNRDLTLVRMFGKS